MRADPIDRTRGLKTVSEVFCKHSNRRIDVKLLLQRFEVVHVELPLPNVFKAVGTVQYANSAFLFGDEKYIVFIILGLELSIFISDEISQLPLGYLLLLMTHDRSYE